MKFMAMTIFMACLWLSAPALAKNDSLRLKGDKALIVFVLDKAAYVQSRNTAIHSGAATGRFTQLQVNSTQLEPFMLTIGPVDLTTHKVTYNRWTGNAFTVAHTDPVSGVTLLVTQVPAGDYSIYSHVVNNLWADCFNKQTIAFSVKPGTINYIGDYNPFPASLRIFDAVDRGKLPEHVNSLTQQSIVDDALNGLTAAGNVPGGETRVKAALSGIKPELYAKPFDLTEPEVISLDLVLGGQNHSRSDCPI